MILSELTPIWNALPKEAQWFFSILLITSIIIIFENGLTVFDIVSNPYAVITGGTHISVKENFIIPMPFIKKPDYCAENPPICSNPITDTYIDKIRSCLKSSITFFTFPPETCDLAPSFTFDNNINRTKLSFEMNGSYFIGNYNLGGIANTGGLIKYSDIIIGKYNDTETEKILCESIADNCIASTNSELLVINLDEANFQCSVDKKIEIKNYQENCYKKSGLYILDWVLWFFIPILILLFKFGWDNKNFVMGFLPKNG